MHHDPHARMVLATPAIQQPVRVRRQMSSVQYQLAALMQPTHAPTGLMNLVPSHAARLFQEVKKPETIKLLDLVPSLMGHLFQDAKETELTGPCKSCGMCSQYEI